jgi:hypothetical protein
MLESKEAAAMIRLDLNTNDAEALLRHAKSFESATGDVREDSRLLDALRDLAETIEELMDGDGGLGTRESGGV